MAVHEGTGAAIVLSGTGVTLKATSIQSQGVAWTPIESTHLGSTDDGKTFIRGEKYDPGTIAVNFQTEVSALVSLENSSTSETITITYPDYPSGTSSTEAATGFIQDFEPGTCEIDTLITGSMTIKRSGGITFTDGSST